MKQDLTLFLPLLLIVPFIMSAISYSKSLSYKRREFRNLSEFFLSLSLYSVCSWMLLPLGGAFIILSMLSWIWMLRTAGLISQDISGQVLFSKFHSYALVFGGVISIILLSFDFPMSTITAPFALSVGLIGLTFIFQSYSRSKIKSYSYLKHVNLLLILVFFASRIFFPVLISSETRMTFVSIMDFYFLMLFCISLYPLYSEITFEDQERLLEKVLHTRNRQLLTHSGFSEYKILAAGLSHELNNALTIINAKILRLLRTHPEIENDLQVLHRASVRINAGVRGLRDFIYPHEGMEILDLDSVVNEVLKLYGQRLVNHGVEVKVENLKDRLIKGQRVQLAQIFLSLINSSADALDTLDERWINISARSCGPYIEITYEDSSRSKAEEIKQILDDPYYSFQEFMDNDIRLIQVKEITEKHGGTFEVKPQMSHTVFVIKLPEEEAIQSSDSRLGNKIDEVREQLH